MPTLPKNRVKTGLRLPKPRTAPLWAGPGGVGPEGGVTFSLLNRYLGCKERFRLKAIEGLVPAPAFEPRIEFGNLWHTAEEAYAVETDWRDAIKRYAVRLGTDYRLARSEIEHWTDIALALFRAYLEHWGNHPDVVSREPVLAETPFDVPYELPSGRVVRLRGKWDSIDLVRRNRKPTLVIQENKTKSAIHQERLTRQLTFDLQTMLYVLALGENRRRGDTTGHVNYGIPNVGTYTVRYNVVRRPAHKSVESMWKKLGDDRDSGRVGEWFARWDVPVSADDLTSFQRTCLDPLLENLVDDYEWWASCKNEGKDVWDDARRAFVFRLHRSRHFRYPFGVYNPLEEGGGTDLDEYLLNGSEVGLVRAETLFPELV